MRGKLGKLAPAARYDAERKQLRIVRQHAETVAAACKAVEEMLVKGETLEIGVSSQHIAACMARVEKRTRQLLAVLHPRSRSLHV